MFSNDKGKTDHAESTENFDEWKIQDSSFPPAPPIRSSSTVYVQLIYPNNLICRKRIVTGGPPLKPLPLPPRKPSKKKGKAQFIALHLACSANLCWIT